MTQELQVMCVIVSVNNGLIVLALMGAKNMSVIFVVIKIMSLNILQQLFVLNDFFGLPNYYFFNLCVFSFNRTSNDNSVVTFIRSEECV